MELFKDWFKVHLGKEPDWEKLIECIDMDKDGQIEWGEFVTAATNRYRLLMNEENMRTAFNVLDMDGSGEITLDELKECFSYSSLDNEASTEQDQGFWDTMLAELDANGDGKISFEEFQTHMMGLIEKGNFELRPNLQEQSTSKTMVSEKFVPVAEENSDIDSGESDNF